MGSAPLRVGIAAMSAAALVLAPGLSTDAHADDPPPSPPTETTGRLAVLLPTTIVDGHERRLPTAAEPDLVVIASGLDALLTDTAQDLGLVVELTQRALPDVRRLADADLPAQAKSLGGLVIVPSLTRVGGALELRMVLADPQSRALLLRVEKTSREDLSVRAVVMLRDLVREASGARGSAGASASPLAPQPTGLATPAKSAGRAVLVLNATAFGGVAGYSLQRSSGSDDARLLYPLLAVGAGIGLGGSIIVAEEWDVGVGDAWFLAAGAWWPTLAGHLIHAGRFGDTAGEQERWGFGLIGGTTGVALSTVWLSLGGMSEGGAFIAHSGGGVGLMLGGLTELFARGDIETTPLAGMGYGAGLGWLAASAFARKIHVAPTRVLALDIGAVLGGLGGAALASPLIFDSPSAGAQRAWVGIAAGSAVVGTGIAWYATRQREGEASSAPSRRTASVGLPTVGVLGESRAGERRAPVWGMSWQGAIP